MKVKEDYQFQGQITIFDVLNLDIWSGKMSQEHSVPEIPKELTSEQSLKKSLKSWSRKSPIFLSLKRDGLTPDASKEWEMMEHPSALLGDCTMLNTGESPNEERESHLSQILEVNPPPKYSLSARACQGILNRANRRGKQLPEILEKALIRQSASKREQDVQGEVKEFSSNTTEPEHCQPSTINPSSDDVYCIQGNCIDRSDTAGCNGKGWRTNESFTLNTVDHHAVCQPTPDEPILLESSQNHTTIQTNGISTCLPASMGEGGGYVPIVCGVDAFNQDITGNKSKSLNSAATDSDHVPCVMESKAIESHAQDARYKNGELSDTEKEQVEEWIDAVNSSAKHQQDLIQSDLGVARTIACGTHASGSHLTKTLITSAISDKPIKETKDIGTKMEHDAANDGLVYAVDQGAGKSGCNIDNDKTSTLITTHGGEPAICYGIDRSSFNQGKNAKYDFSVEEDKAQTLVSRGPGGVMTLSEAYVQETRKE